jgi:general stress protein 26
MVVSNKEMRRLKACMCSGLIFVMVVGISLVSNAQLGDNDRLATIARGIMIDVRFAGLTTIDSLGYPNTRTMDALPPTDDFEIWLATNPLSRKVRQIQENTSVALYYPQSGKGNYVTLIGSASIVDDPQSKIEKWREEWAEFYPTKEDMVLIKVEPIRLEVVSYEHGIISESIDWKAPELNLLKN